MFVPIIRKNLLWSAVVPLSLLYSAPALACDVCAPFIADVAKEGDLDSVSVGILEQYTDRRELRDDGEKIDNPENQFLTSSSSQLYAGYQQDRLFGQITLPMIYRDYRRVEDGQVQRGHESGIGDLLLVMGYTPVKIIRENTTLRWRVYGGLKLPTGDSNELKPQTGHTHGDTPAAEDHHSDGDEHGRPSHAHGGVDHGVGGEEDGDHDDDDHDNLAAANVIHGHDIALGSGSIDFLVGTSVYFRSDRFVNRIFTQYFFRNEGAYDYTYGNDVTWSINPGYVLWAEDAGSIELGMNFWGEYKGYDVQDGNQDPETVQTNLYLGPQLGFTIGENWSGLVAVDIPVYTDNTDVQTVPDWRSRVGVTYRF